MRTIDRRTLLKTGAAVAASGHVPAWIAGCASTQSLKEAAECAAGLRARANWM